MVCMLLSNGVLPGGNNWMVTLLREKKRTLVCTMTWFHDRKGRLAALWTARGGSSYYIDPHMIQRYGERHLNIADPLARLKSFFEHNPTFSAITLEEGPERSKVALGMVHGMGLGVWHRSTDIVHIRTFVNHRQLFHNQREDMKLLDLKREVARMTPGQFKELVKKAGMDPGMAQQVFGRAA